MAIPISPIGFGLIGILLYLASALVHEIGHLYTLKQHEPKSKIRIFFEGKRLKITAGEEETYNKLEKKELYNIYLSGIVWGAVLIILTGVLIHWILFFITIPYIYACKKDINCWIDLMKEGHGGDLLEEETKETRQTE
jgi:membrane-bound acyltransferase YfiQ involved in biofilm formation